MKNMIQGGMSMSEGLKHICFDLDDTLYEQIAPFRQALFRIHPAGDGLMRELYKGFRVRSNEMFFLHQNNEISFEAMHIKRIQLALADHGIQISDKEALEFQAGYQRGQYEIALSSTIREMLDYLKDRDVKISMITNGPTEHQLRKIKSLGLQSWIDERDIVISSSAGVSKPDQRIFHIVGESGLYVGDSYENDVVGAKGAGWKVIWLNKYQLPDTEKLADHIVRDEGELLDRIKNYVD